MSKESTERRREVPLGALLGSGRRAYGSILRAALTNAGFDDLPESGVRFIGGMARHGPNVIDVAEDLRISPQAASQLVDVLVARDYCEMTVDQNDRRRRVVALTKRGQRAARTVRETNDAVEQALLERMGPRRLKLAEELLRELIDLAPPAIPTRRHDTFEKPHP